MTIVRSSPIRDAAAAIRSDRSPFDGSQPPGPRASKAWCANSVEFSSIRGSGVAASSAPRILSWISPFHRCRSKARRRAPASDSLSCQLRRDERSMSTATAFATRTSSTSPRPAISMIAPSETPSRGATDMARSAPKNSENPTTATRPGAGGKAAAAYPMHARQK